MSKALPALLLLAGLALADCRSVAPAEAAPEDPPAAHPALGVMREYLSVEAPEIVVVPYIVNLMAIDLLKRDLRRDAVKHYIDWYLSHLNYPDRYGATGSIYDYRVYRDGREQSLGTMDSLDSYAATFAILVDHYLARSGDRHFVAANRGKLEDIAYLIPFLQDADGLTVAIPGTPFKYLMDNCEAYGGMLAFAGLAEEMDWEIGRFYRERAAALAAAIRRRFADAGSGNFYWSVDGLYKTPSAWTIFYPDAYAQLFPILYGLVYDPLQPEALWETFDRYQRLAALAAPVEQQIVYRWTKALVEKGGALLPARPSASETER